MIDDIIPKSNDEEINYVVTYDETDNDARKQFHDIGKLSESNQAAAKVTPEKLNEMLESGYGIVKEEPEPAPVMRIRKKKLKVIEPEEPPKSDAYYVVIKTLVIVFGLIILFTATFFYVRKAYNDHMYLNPEAKVTFSGVPQQQSVEDRAKEIVQQELAARELAAKELAELQKPKQSLLGGLCERLRDSKGRFMKKR